MALGNKILVCVPTGTSYLYMFTNTYGSNLTVYSDDAWIYDVPVGEWVKLKTFDNTYYAVAVVSGRTIASASALNVRNSGSNGVKKWVYDKTSQQISDPDLYGGNYLTPYLLKEYVPAVTSVSVTVGGSSGSTSLKVGEQKAIVVTATYDDGSTKTVTDSATLTCSNTNISIE